MESLNHKFSLLSINTFGVPFFLSWGRLVRLTKELERLGMTIVCLQEIQQNAYAGLLKYHLSTYPHGTLFPHIYAPKGGLGTFSRQPFTHQRFEPYIDRKLEHIISFADWALYKGVVVVELQFDELKVFVLNTHLNANYFGDWRHHNSLAAFQLRQVQQLSRMLKDMPEDALIILCGDFNFPRPSFLYEELVTPNGLSDPLREDPRPTYRPFPLVPSRWKISLDYILLRVPQERNFNIKADILPIEDSTKRCSFQRFLTDHCALTLTISWE